MQAISSHVILEAAATYCFTTLTHQLGWGPLFERKTLVQLTHSKLCWNVPRALVSSSNLLSYRSFAKVNALHQCAIIASEEPFPYNTPFDVACFRLLVNTLSQVALKKLLPEMSRKKRNLTAAIIAIGGIALKVFLERQESNYHARYPHLFTAGSSPEFGIISLCVIDVGVSLYAQADVASIVWFLGAIIAKKVFSKGQFGEALWGSQRGNGKDSRPPLSHSVSSSSTCSSLSTSSL